MLEGRELRRVGGAQTIPVDARIVAATNRDLRAMVGASTFREDLYYRLGVVTIELPPLRARVEELESRMARRDAITERARRAAEIASALLDELAEPEGDDAASAGAELGDTR